MISVGEDDDDFNDELNLKNPYSHITCFIMYLYSLEIGAPTLYSEINRVARSMDFSHLETLGPIQRALSKITKWAEFYKVDKD